MSESDEPEIRQATAADVQALFGKPISRTIKAWSVFWKGELVCIAGYTVEHGGCVVFSDVKPGIEASKLLKWRTIKRLMQLIADTPTPLLAATTPENTSSRKLLRLLGFCDSGRMQDGYRVYYRGL